MSPRGPAPVMSRSIPPASSTPTTDADVGAVRLHPASSRACGPGIG
jgi:hypothetical protein